ncbi:DUF7289 family protein [Haloarcula salina]|uniref:Uncharacterized protein n=1 Tax=Haloarcula salina TaxID=1429914 RepID=A0AA41G1R7_9EURY|nr:hypothetical protein [Haloarcula salina]MBV0901803.1 hypothetical protein [Haloarcula salina]
MADRGVSEVLSFVLVFTLIIASITLVSVGGLGTLQDARNAEQLNNAERAFDILTDNIADLYQRGAPSRATEISLGEAQLRTGENVTMSVEVDSGSGYSRVGQWEIRPIVFEGDEERRIVYEAGGVYRTNRDGGLRIRDPPLVVDENHVLITVVGINRPETQSLGGSTVLVRANHRDTDIAFEDTSGDVEGVRINVTGPRSDLWEAYFEEKGFTCATGDDWCEYTDGGGIERTYVVYHDIRVDIDQ